MIHQKIIDSINSCKNVEQLHTCYVFLGFVGSEEEKNLIVEMIELKAMILEGNAIKSETRNFIHS